MCFISISCPFLNFGVLSKYVSIDAEEYVAPEETALSFDKELV